MRALAELPDGSAHLIVTDPPYGHSNNSGNDLIGKWEAALGKPAKGVPRPIANDGKEANDLFRSFLIHAKRLLANGGCCCCCCGGGGGPDPQFARWSLWMDEVLHFKQMIVIDKGPMGLGWHYRRSYETVLVAQRDAGACNWYDTTMEVENIVRPGARGIRKIIPSASHHPTEKAPELAEFFIRLHTQPGDVVLDPFLGSGAFGEAAVKLGRHFIGIEIDPEHFRRAEQRIRLAESEASAAFFAPTQTVQDVQAARRKKNSPGMFPARKIR